MDVEKVRKDFPILERKVHGKQLVYLDNAATAQKPVQVIQAEERFYQQHNSNVHRAVYTISEEATKDYEEAHEKTANFIAADGLREIVFTRNATEALNLVMYAWALPSLQKEDEIVCTVMEHHSNIVPWQFMEKRGIKLNFVDVDDDGTLKMGQFNELVNENTRLVAVSHCSNILGTINDVKTISKLAHEQNALVVVDAAQSVPHMPVSVKELGCDFLAFSGHKMLAPMNIGVLWGRRELLQEMNPFLYGGDMIKEVHLHDTVFNDLPWKFEAGTPNVSGGVGLAAAIDYLNAIGMHNVREHEKRLTAHALKRLKEIPELTVYGPQDPEKKGGVVSFNLAGVPSHDVATILDSHGIAVRSGNGCAMPLMQRLGVSAVSRASFYIYNTLEEIDLLAEALVEVRKTFGLQ